MFCVRVSWWFLMCCWCFCYPSGGLCRGVRDSWRVATSHAIVMIGLDQSISHHSLALGRAAAVCVLLLSFEYLFIFAVVTPAARMHLCILAIKRSGPKRVQHLYHYIINCCQCCACSSWSGVCLVRDVKSVRCCCGVFFFLRSFFAHHQAVAGFFKWTRLLHTNNKVWIFIKLHKEVSVLIWSTIMYEACLFVCLPIPPLTVS